MGNVCRERQQINKENNQTPLHSHLYTAHLGLDSVAALGEVLLLLLLLERDGVQLVLREGTAESAGLLGAEISRLVLAAGIELAELALARLVDDGEDAGNTLADRVAKEKKSATNPNRNGQNAHLGELRGSTAADLSDTEAGKLRLQLLEALKELILAEGAEFVRLVVGLHRRCGSVSTLFEREMGKRTRSQSTKNPTKDGARASQHGATRDEK